MGRHYIDESALCSGREKFDSLEEFVTTCGRRGRPEGPSLSSRARKGVGDYDGRFLLCNADSSI